MTSAIMVLALLGQVQEVAGQEATELEIRRAEYAARRSTAREQMRERQRAQREAARVLITERAQARSYARRARLAVGRKRYYSFNELLYSPVMHNPMQQYGIERALRRAYGGGYY